MTKFPPTSINPGPGLHAYLDFLGPRGPREGVSRVIERLAGRYLYGVRGALPEWSLPEWTVVVETLHGHDMGSTPGLQALGLVIQAAVEHKRPGLGTSLANLAYQAKRLPAPGLAAVAEVVEGYWRRHEDLVPEQLASWLRAIPAPGFEAPSPGVIP